MSLFTDRIALAMKRSIAYFGVVDFTLKDGGTVFQGNLGQKNSRVFQRSPGGGKKIETSQPLMVEKRVMTQTPVVGRVITVNGVPLEIGSFDQDAVSWTIHLVTPKQG